MVNSSTAAELPTQYELAMLKRKRDLLRRQKELKENNGLLFYRPHKKQHLFHAIDKRHRYVRTGNRFGKSDAGAAEDVAWAIGERSWYRNTFDILDGKGEIHTTHQGSSTHPLLTQGLFKRPVRILILCADWDKSQDIFTNPQDGKLWKFIPKDKIAQAPHKNHSGVIDCIYIRSIYGGISTINIDTIKSFKSNPMGSESSYWDAIHVDEPIPEDMWKAHARGLMDKGGKSWFLCTPIEEPWINDRFIPSVKGRKYDLDKTTVNTFEATEFANRAVITGDTRDNPYLAEEDIVDFESDLAPEEIECRIQGIPLIQSGTIYKAFDYDKHVYTDTPKGWREMYLPPKDYTIRLAIDPHPQTPHAVLFAATSPLGQTFFFSEIFEQILIGDLCEQIKSITHGYTVLRYLCDPIAWINNPVTGEKMADDFFKHGLPVEKATKELTRGIMMVQSALRRDDYIYFSQQCQETLNEFGKYRWDTKKFNKPVDKDDHFMECLYRLVLDGLNYVDPNEPVPDPIAIPEISSPSLSLPNVDRLISGGELSYIPAKERRRQRYNR